MTDKTKSDGAADDGGPAMPFEFVEGGEAIVNPGMTLRDYFAAKAMQGMVALEMGAREVQLEFKAATYAAHAYKVADAMIAQRKGGIDDR